MPISINGTTGISGIVSLNAASANTPIILQDSGSNSNTCRAWVNFNGTGTPAIRASFNVSSITDNGTGDYTINFTTAMPDVDYAAVTGARENTALGANSSVVTPVTYNTSSLRVQTSNLPQNLVDMNFLNVSIFR
jgi:hypothetical protein